MPSATTASPRRRERLSSLTGGVTDDWARRRSSPPGPLSASTFDSIQDALSVPTSRRTSTLSPPLPTTKSPSLKHESLMHRLRSNSGLSLHTNEGALRQYTDYNPDGSVRFSQFDPVDWQGDTFSILSAATAPPDSRYARESLGIHANGSTTKFGIPDFFGRDVVQMVMRNPTTVHRLRQFAQSRGNSDGIEFLSKVEDYSRAVNEVISSIAGISTNFTSITATSPLNLPPQVSRSLNADVKHISRSILPGLEILFQDARAHVEQRVIREIYPEFVKHQLSICMRSFLSGNRATTATFNFEYPGLGDAFVLTDPYRGDNPIVYASDGFVNATGYSRSEIIPRNCRFLQGPLTDAAAVTRIRDGIAQNEEKVELILNYRKDGQPFWNMLYVCPLKGPNGKVRFFFGGQINVSESIGGHKDVLRILNTGPEGPAGVISTRKRVDFREKNQVDVPVPPERKRTKLERGGSIRGRKKTDQPRPEKHAGLGFLNPFRRNQDSGVTPPPSRRGHSPPRRVPSPSRAPETSNVGLEATLQSRSMTEHLSLLTQFDDFRAAYSRFMCLQFVPSTSYGDVPPVRGRANFGARLKVGFCSLAVLETLGLGPGAQEAVLYHDIFSVLSELAGSPSVTSGFKATVRENLSVGDAVSVEILIPLPASSGGAGGGSGRKGSFAAFGSRGGDGEDGRASRRRSENVEKLLERRPPTADAGWPRLQRLMSHWTPVKDADGAVAWVVLVITPIVER